MYKILSNILLLLRYTADSLQSRCSQNFGAGGTLGILFFILWPTINWIDSEYYNRNSYLWKICFCFNKKKNIEFWYKCHFKKLQSMQFSKFALLYAFNLSSQHEFFSFIYERVYLKYLYQIKLNKTNRCTEFQFYWFYDSTCFGQPFCLLSGVLSRTSKF